MSHEQEAAVLEHARNQDRDVLKAMMREAADFRKCSQNENQLARHLSCFVAAFDILTARLESISESAANHEYADCYVLAENALGRDPDTSMGV